MLLRFVFVFIRKASIDEADGVVVGWILLLLLMILLRAGPGKELKLPDMVKIDQTSIPWMICFVVGFGAVGVVKTTYCIF